MKVPFRAAAAVAVATGLTMLLLTQQQKPALAQSYTLTDLGPLAGASSSTAGSAASAINTAGDAAGHSMNAQGQTIPTLWPSNGSGPQALSTLIGYEAYGNEINNAGQIAGYGAYKAGSMGYYYHATLWTNGVVKDLGALKGGFHSFAIGLNDAGQVVGHSQKKLDRTTSGYVAVLWQGGSIIQLPTLGGRRGSAKAISSDGKIVGDSELSDNSTTRAFLFTPSSPNGATGSVVDLGTLGGAYSRAFAINSQSEVVGVAATATGEGRAFLWRPGGQGMVRLDDALGTTCIRSEALAINDYGVVAGKWIPSWQPNGSGYAFVYQNGIMTDLNAPGVVANADGWHLAEARAVNSSGHIVGYGRVNGVARGFLLRPL